MQSLIIATRKAAVLAFDHAPLGIMVIVIVALAIGIIDYAFGPVSAGYAHVQWQ
jgi:rRNA processing protein Gar1